MTIEATDIDDRRAAARQIIEAARTPAGGWTKDQLASWGVSWPPKKGWKAELMERWSHE